MNITSDPNSGATIITTSYFRVGIFETYIQNTADYHANTGYMGGFDIVDIKNGWFWYGCTSNSLVTGQTWLFDYSVVPASGTIPTEQLTLTVNGGQSIQYYNVDTEQKLAFVVCIACYALYTCR
jgi:hypothetical protein